MWMARRPLEPETSEAQPAKRRPRRQLQPEVGAGSTGRDGGRLLEVVEPGSVAIHVPFRAQAQAQCVWRRLPARPHHRTLRGL